MGAYTLLQTLTKVCEEIGIPAPATVVGTSDMQVIQLRGFANATGDALRDDYDWPFLRKLATISTISGTTTYAPTVASGFTINSFIDNTGWDQNNFWTFVGSISDIEWNAWQFGIRTAPIRGIWRSLSDSSLELFPAPTQDGLILSIEANVYEWAINSQAGSSPAMQMANDGDTHVFNDRLMISGTKWRFLEQKGLPFAGPKAEYDRLLPIRKGKSRPKRTLSMDPRSYDRLPLLTYRNVPDTGFGA